MGDVVLYEVSEGVAIVTLNRPDRLNTWTSELANQYFDALDRAEADPEVRVIVVTGAGRGFCAGADMDMLQGKQGSADDNATWNRPMTHPLTLRKPIIAAVNGACAGVGFVAALLCDIRFAAAGAKFTSAFSRRGLIAEHGSSWILPRLAGPARALDVLLSGRVFLAEEAAEMGIVNKVFPADSLMTETMAYARDLAVNASPTSMAIIKRQVYQHLEADVNTALKESNELMVESFQRDDFQEGVTSFVEKRPPAFKPVG
jgi:enoyl-CoA hydratase/carnithine racemase